MVFEFRDYELFSALAKLPDKWRSAFAAACSTRLVPIYDKYHNDTGVGSPTIIHQALNYGWNAIADPVVEDSTCNEFIEILEQNIPAEEEQSKYRSFAEDAAAAVAFTLESLVDSDPQNAVWAAKRVHAAIWSYVEEELAIDITCRNATSIVNSQKSIQLELHRQMRDLREIASCPPSEFTALLKSLRERAESEPAIPLS